MKHIISLGAGVQSSTMALMAVHGEITPMPDSAIFADTGAEPQGVYDWLNRLEGELPFPVKRVSRPNVIENALKIRVSKKTGLEYIQSRIPAYTLNSKGEKGMMWRQCTAFWKVEPIQKAIKEFTGEGVTMWPGISTDEAQRQKDSRKDWIVNRYPLIEKMISRNDCLDWMTAKGYPQPPRSACSFCPYHSDKEWIRLKREEPKEFANAVNFERRLQKQVAKMESLDSQMYLHGSRKPLDEVLFRHEDQPDMFGNECEGMCGN